jgi:hypothetical protein
MFNLKILVFMLVFGVCYNLSAQTLQQELQAWHSVTNTQNFNNSTFRASNGSYKGSAQKYNNRVTFRDQSGRIKGSSYQNGNIVTFRDASGRIMGTSNINTRPVYGKR